MKSKLTKKKLVEAMNVLGMTFLALDVESKCFAKDTCSPEPTVDMMDVKYEPCGTIACHAGWFGIAADIKDTPTFARNGFGMFHEAIPTLARHLGFETRADIEDWASENHKLWGNLRGAAMFNDEEAFGKTHSVTLKDIGLHWLKVAARVKASRKKRV